MSLTAATRSEFTKQLTTSMWWILAIVLAAYIGFTATALGFIFSASATGNLPSGSGSRVPTTGIADTLYSVGASVGYVFPLLIGTLMVTAEFRHQTLTPTFLATPRRGLVLAAKVIVGIVVGVVYGILTIVVTVGPAAGFLAGFGLHTGLDKSDTWAMLGRILIAFVLWAIIGIGVGALVRNQVAAIVIVLVFTQFIGPIAQVAGTLLKGLDQGTRFLPSAAGDALIGSSIFSLGGTGGAAPATLEWWAGGLVLLGYAIVLLVLGHLFSWRRDVT